jgi:hypothetical protein
VSERSYTTPLKTSSVPFKPNGVWRGVVTSVSGFGVWVRVPRLSGDLEYGPLDVVAPNDTAMPVVADPVLVGFVEGRQDELVVLGVVKTSSSSSTGGSGGTVVTATTSGTTAGQQLDAFSASEYRSVKYVVQAVSSSGYRVSELLAVHDGTTASFTEYGVIVMGTDPVTSYDVNYLSGDMILSVTPSASAVDFTMTRSATAV